jgi:serine/threonine protein kinase
MGTPRPGGQEISAAPASSSGPKAPPPPEKTPERALSTAVSPERAQASPAIADASGIGGAAKYTILGSIHRGGMGEILLAKVEGAGGFVRKVVLKGLLSRLSEDNVSYQLFMREARLMACLDHPNIVRVFDLPYIGEKPYLAMEYLRGRNFHQVIQRSGITSTGMPIRVALHVVAEALRGLHYAHNAKDENGSPMGVIHRDVSPGNILVSFFGEVKVTDFGIAKIANAPKFTGPRSIRGKARYVAPEQIHGEPASVLSDIYSAGVVLAEALLGEPLWERATVPETLLSIVTEDREKTIDRVLNNRPHISGLRAALRGALALNPKDRFSSALQFAETLEAISRTLGGACTHVDLGIYVRRLFAEAPDVPSDDGFGVSGLPVPEFDVDRLQTDPTIITLEPGWIKDQRKVTESMRAGPPAASRGRSHPSKTPTIEPLEAPKRRRTGEPERSFSGRSSRPPPTPEPERKPAPSVPTRVRATPVPPQAAVVQDVMPSGGSEYSFSELIPGYETDEEPSRDVDRMFVEKSPARASQKRARAVRADSAESGVTSTHGMTLLIAGIFIGASLAIAGCVLALMMGH